MADGAPSMRESRVAGQLRRLADRVEAGEVSHVTIRVNTEAVDVTRDGSLPPHIFDRYRRFEPGRTEAIVEFST